MKLKSNYLTICAVTGVFLFNSMAFSDSLDSKKQNEIKDKNITVMGTRTKVDIAKYPGSVNVIKADDLKISSSVIEDLSNVPGFETGGGVGRNIGQQFTIRGFGYQSEERVIIKQDGIRRSTAMFSNHISSFRTDPEILKNVEVIKGSSSIAHGGGAIGGVVGMTTKDAFDYLEKRKNIGTKVIARYERNNYRSTGIALYGNPNGGKFDYLFYGKYGKTGNITPIQYEDNTEIDNDEQLINGFIKIGYQANTAHRFKLSLFQLHEDVKATWQTIYHSTYPDDGPVVGDLDQSDIVLGYAYNPANDYINLDANIFYSKGAYDRQYDLLSRDILINYENKDTSWGLNLKNETMLATGNIKHKLLAGIDFTKRNEDAIYYRNEELSDFGSMPNNYTDIGLFIQDEIPLMQDKLIFYLGGRYDRFERSVDNKAVDYDSHRFSPRVGTSFEIFNHFNLLANYSEAFRAPIPSEIASEGPLNPHYWYLPNPDLGPEISKETEFGFSYENNEINNGKLALWLRALYFIGDIEDMISLKELTEMGESPDESPYATYKNVAKAEREGFEIESKLTYNNFRINGSYEHLDQYDSQTLEKVPNGFADKLMLGFRYTYTPWGITFGMDINHWFDPDQNPEYRIFRGKRYDKVNESYTITNLRAKWIPQNTGLSFFDNGFELFAGINNLLNDEYINARGYTNSSRRGKGRNIFFNLSKKF